MRSKMYLPVLLIAAVFPLRLFALSVSLVGDSVVDQQALTLSGGKWGDVINGMTYQQDAVVSCNGWQYVSYYNDQRYVCVARRQLSSDSWEVVELTDYYFAGNDSHNIISMGICPNDGTIHLSFDHHGGALHYRISQAGAATNPSSIQWDSSLFSSTRNYLEAGKTVSSVTYPRFWQTPDGNLQMYYRSGGSGNGDSMLADYDAAGGSWKNTRMVISRSGSYSDLCGSSTSRNAYVNYPFYGSDGRLHWTWCWRESSGGTNHDICYAWSDDQGYTWYNTLSGQKIQIGTGSGSSLQVLLDLQWKNTQADRVADFAAGQKITVASPGIIAVPITRYYSLMNQQSQAIDPQGRVHTVMYYETDGAGCDVWSGDAYHHYWRDTDGTWKHTQIPFSRGSRPKLFFNAAGNLLMVYIRSGRVYVAGATAATGWTDWANLRSVYNNYFGEGLGDACRMQQDGVLSVMAQVKPSSAGQSTALHILDFQITN